MAPRQTSLVTASVAAFALLQHNAAAAPASRRQDTQTYEPTWESTDNHNAAPEWFKDAKFGVYWHWGAFSTPEFGFEWYPRQMFVEGDSINEHHKATYGSPNDFGHDKFINGADDLSGNFTQFKPVLVGEGGQFDPEGWMEVIKASGAKFAGPVAEHHDGYAMWDSSVNEWNSARLGPQLDLVKIFADLIRGNDMKLLIAMHTAFHANGYFSYAPAVTDPGLQKLYGQQPFDEQSKLWAAKQNEALDHVKPDIVWNDFGLDSPGYCHGSSDHCSINEADRLDFLAHYFNRGIEWNQEVLTSWKHFDKGFRSTSAVEDYERGGPADITRPYWLTDDAVSASSWSYTKGMTYYSSKSMVHSLLDRISKNGNLLLNIAPTAAGIIPSEQEQVLRDIGAYLERYGESVYETRAWDVYGEGPNKAGGGSFTAPLEGDSRDIRFTRNQAETVLYATILGWPDSGQTIINSLGADRSANTDGLTIQLLGDSAGQYTEITDWKQTSTGLEITLPTKPAESLAYVLKLAFPTRIPVIQPESGAAVFTNDQADGKGVTLGLGDFKAAFLSDAGLESALVSFIRVSSGTKITVYSNGDLTGTSVALTQGDHFVDKGSVGSIRAEKA